MHNSTDNITRHTKDENGRMLESIQLFVDSLFSLRARIKHDKNIRLELEARFFDNNMPNAKGISEKKMNLLLGCFENSAHVNNFEIIDWTEIHDVFYKQPREGGKKPQTVRSTSWGDKNTLILENEDIIKNRIKLLRMVTNNNTDGCKLCLSTEMLISVPTPVVVRPMHVRIKQRKSFIYKTPDNAVTWRYDFSMCWEGKTKLEAEIAQQNNMTVYEFEIELVDFHEDICPKYLAESLLLKIRDHCDVKYII